MKRVPNNQYLYRRGDTYQFRRAVPPYARHEFGGASEVIRSLKTTDLQEARHRLYPLLQDFDQRIARATGRRDPTLNLPGQPLPTLGEIEAAVRSWLKNRLQRDLVATSADEQDALARCDDLGQQAEAVRRGFGRGRHAPPQLTRWIAEDIQQKHGWRLGEDSPLHRHLLRVVGRGEIEATEQIRDEVELRPRRVRDATFGPEQYLLDANSAKDRPPVSIMSLFDGYVAEARPKPATIKAWRHHLNDLIAHLGHDDASIVRPSDLIKWKDKLLSETTRRGTKRDARTVKNKYLSAAHAAFRWGAENGKIGFDPTSSVRVRVPKKPLLRDRGLTEDEALAILRGALQQPPPRLTAEHARARRWVPWICAYTGARVNEITQLRAEDVSQIAGCWTIRITPEAGSVKSDEARIVPLHSHIIDQGFLLAMSGLNGPLFYDPARAREGSQGNPQYKKVGERLAAWVREIGVSDPGVAPNHGWRHRFKTQARLVGMDPEIRDVIQGHAPRTQGEAYGGSPVSVL